MTSGRGLAAAAEALAFGLLAFVVRLLPWRSVFADPVQFAGNDAYYHARRILYAVQHFPDVLRFDPYINFPHGGEAIWSPLMDGGVALLARSLGADTPERLDPFIVWLPPLVGALAVVGLWWVAQRWTGLLSARVAAGLLAILPAHYIYSRLGFVDHHVLVSATSVLLLATAMRLLHVLAGAGAGAGSGAGSGGAVRAALVSGAVLGASLAVWPGMLLHVGIVEAALLVFWATRPPGLESTRVAWAAAAAQVAALLVVSPFAWGVEWQRWGAFSPVVLSNFQPWLFSVGGAVYSVLALQGRSGRGPAGAVVRLALALLLGAIGVGLTAAVSPASVAAIADDAWGWFARQENFQAVVSESRPLFGRAGGVDWLQPALLLTPLLYVLPFVLWSEWRSVGSGADRAPRLTLIAWTAVLLAATLVQARFFNSLSVAVCWLLGALAARTVVRAGRAGAVVVAAALVCAVGTSLFYYREVMADPTTYGEAGDPAMSVLDERRSILVEVAIWIRENTPPTSGWLDASVAPEYAIMSPWTDGHVLGYRGQRPTVANNFGDDIGEENFALSETYYLLNEARASGVLDRLRARYALFEYRPISRFRDFGPKALISRLYFADGEAADTAVISRDGSLRNARLSLPAIERHRLVYESRTKPRAGQEARAAFKLYEHVAGARIEGLADPGAGIEISLPLSTNRGRTATYRARILADDRGHYAARVPYSTQGAPPAVTPAPAYGLSTGDRRSQLVVTEADVQNGLVVRGPDLRASAQGASISLPESVERGVEGSVGESGLSSSTPN